MCLSCVVRGSVPRTAFVSFVADLALRCRDLCSDELGAQLNGLYCHLLSM